jgi:hypothetical protein
MPKVRSASLERGAAVPYPGDPHVVSRIRPGMRLLGGVRGLLFHEVLFVRAARAYGDVGSQRDLFWLMSFDQPRCRLSGYRQVDQHALGALI